MLDIVVVLIEQLLSLCQETISLFLINQLLLGGWHLEGALFVEVEHSLLSRLSSGHCRLLLLLEETALLDLCLLGGDLGGGFHALELVVLDDDGFGFLALLGLLADVAQLLLGQGSDSSGLVLFGVA